MTEHNTWSEMSSEREELLWLLLEDEGVTLTQEAVIPIRVDRETAPLSFAQERLWFLDRLIPNGAIYNIPLVLRLRGVLDRAILAQTLNEMVQRHEILRTTFPTRDGKPVQQIAAAVSCPLSFVDLRALPPTAREAQTRQYALQESQHLFNLALGPLLRAQLIQLEDDDHVLLLTMHHIISDGWSMALFAQEMGALYAALSQGHPAALPALPIQYADFAAWQRQWLKDDVLADMLAYWRERLANLPLLQLPTDYPRPALPSYQGRVYSWQIDAPLTHQLKTLAQRCDATLFMTLLAGFQALLARYTGQQDIVVGTPIANRSRAETEGLIGFFVNTLVLRTDLSGNPTFRQLLDRVRTTTLQAYDHQDLPFEKLVQELQPERDLSQNPLFQVMFALQNTPEGQFNLPDLDISPLAPTADEAEQTAKFDLNVVLTETPDGITCLFEYSTDLFGEATMARLAKHFDAMLRQIVAQPDWPLETLTFLSVDEQQQLLHEWNDDAAAYASETCLHTLFEAQAVQCPQAVALIYGQTQISYATLNQQANQLAHYLITQGVRPDMPVALCFERSIDLIIAVLAVLKAGGAYLPLDPAYPQERLAFMLQDAGATILLTHSALLAGLPHSHQTTVCLDTQWSLLAAFPDTNPATTVSAQNLAYIIYTSGSTGLPKGVLIPHVNVTRLFAATDAWFHFAAADAWTLFHAYAFDFSVWEMWGAFLYGGKLVIVPYNVSRDPEAFYRLLASEQVTVLNQTPSAFRQLIPVAERNERLSHLRYVIFGGETLHLPALAPWFAHYGDQQPQLINMYGITETTVHVTYQPLHICHITQAKGSIIGGPIPDLQLYLLDAQLQPVPFGVSGELYVGGAGLARGYLNRPALTASRFIPNPFATSPAHKQRLYRTGDLARRLLDGNLEYIGRVDQQVQLRGFRVELGEIETTLCHHPQVQDSVVLLREDQPDDQRLVAYFVVTDTLSTETLRHYLKQHLPDYMIPTAFVPLTALPLTPNGKVDRAALPAPDSLSAPVRVVARDDWERRVAHLWETVLNVHPVDMTRNFFEQGGHSLLAVQLMARIQQEFGQQLPLMMLFRGATVEQLAALLRQPNSGNMLQAAAAITPRVNKTHSPLSFAQERLWFLDQLIPGNSAYNIPFAIRLQGTLEPEHLRQTLRQIVQRHETLRTSFRLIGGEPVQMILPQIPDPVVMVDMRHLSPVERTAQSRLLAADLFKQSFDLSQGPLLRVMLIQLEAAEHILLLVMHHIISDGWSMDVLTKEISAIYEALVNGEPDQLSPLPIQYADFAEWQRRWLQGDTLNKQVAYWQTQLAGLTPLQLSTDFPRPTVPSYRGQHYRFSVNAEVARQLNVLSQASEATLFMTVLAAFQFLLARYTGQTDIAIGTPIANRGRAELENLIGFFVNTLVLRTDLSGAISFRQLLARVRETALGAYAHQDLPFEKLVQILQPKRDLSQNPLFQVMFTLQNSFAPPLELPGLTISALPEDAIGEHEIAKFDLSLDITVAPEGLIGSFQYNSDLFTPLTVARMAEHLVNVLTHIAVQPERPLADLSLLSAREQHLMIRVWNETKTAANLDQNLFTLVAAQAAKTPKGAAVLYQQTCLTYEDLDQRANRLAHYLLRLGVGLETRVGIYMSRTPSLVVALLAVLKAGGAYVPLDPAYPQERLNYMLTDSQAAVLLTETALQELYRPSEAIHTVCLDQLDLNNEPATAPTMPIPSDALAYLIYTSGSTGRPKGVMISHRNAAALITWAHTIFTEAELAGVLAATSVCFDLSVFEIFVPLSRGGTVILVENALALLDLDESTPITLINTVPSVMREILRHSTLPDGVQTVNLAGEFLPGELVEKLYQETAVLKVYDLYGPSEDTTYSTFALRSPGEPATIGKPIANTQAYILDQHLNPVPIGVVGDLYLGGEGVSRGYWQRPRLTATRYIPDLFGALPGGRLYVTGDKATYLPDGRIQFYGRADHQVKIRGFRIELGEIESILRQHPLVEDAVVAVHENESHDKRLVAYVVGPEPTTTSDLRIYLKQHLPDYMVPSDWLYLPSLPQTPSGKIDRSALLAPEYTSFPTNVLARDSWERRVADIWRGVLGVPDVDIRRNFFEQGGHSLLAVQLMARVQEEFGQQVPLMMLFRGGTIEQMAALLQQGETGTTVPMVIPLRNNKNSPPLSFAQERLWFLDQLIPDSSVYHIPFAIHIEGELDRDQLRQTLRQIVQRHEILRTTFPSVEGEPVQRILSEIPEPLTVVDMRQLSPSEQRTQSHQLAVALFGQPFDLSQGPLFRVRLIQLEAGEHILLLVLHHIIADGWSMDVLTKEISAIYGALANGESAVLPPLPIQYADFAEWQRDWLQGEILDEQVSYWQRQLTGLTPLQLPTDFPRPSLPTYRGKQYSFQVSVEVTERLNALSQAGEATLFMTVLAAFQLLLASYTGQMDIAVGTPIANRNHPALENLIGFFVNTLVLRTDLSGDISFQQLLGRVRETALGAYAHQDLPFERLVQIMQPERDLSQTPLFQVMFTFQNSLQPALELPGLGVRAISGEELGGYEVAKFDLSLDLTVTPEGLVGGFQYNSDLFAAATIRRIADHFGNLLAHIAAQPQRAIADLPLLSAHEQYLVTQLGNETKPLTPGDRLNIGSQPSLEQKIIYPVITPGNQWEKRLARIWENVLGLPVDDVNRSFFELGGHSLLAVRLLVKIQQEFGRTLPLATLFQHTTIEQFAAVLRQQTQADDGSLVVLQEGTPDIQPLFLVHPVGGHLFGYLPLLRHLNKQRPVYGLQAQGIEDEQISYQSISDMAAAYVQLIRTVQPEEPYLLAGWSMGGIIALEIAQQLTQQGKIVNQLILLDSFLPNAAASIPNTPQSFTDTELLLAQFAFDLGVTIRSESEQIKVVRQQSSDEQLLYIIQQAKQSGFIPLDFELEQARRLFALFKANHKALQIYVPSLYEGAVALIRADGDKNTPPDLGWQIWLTQPLTICTASGDHYTMMQEPHVRSWINNFKQLINDYG